VAYVYNLREEEALFLKEENLVHAEHLRNEQYVSKLAYLRSSAHSAQMRGNDTYIIIVTDKGEGKYLDMFSRLKGFMEEIIVETSDTESDQCIKDY
jgi:hypothetical protein